MSELDQFIRRKTVRISFAKAMDWEQKRELMEKTFFGHSHLQYQMLETPDGEVPFDWMEPSFPDHEPEAYGQRWAQQKSYLEQSTGAIFF